MCRLHVRLHAAAADGSMLTLGLADVLMRKVPADWFDAVGTWVDAGYRLADISDQGRRESAIRENG
jgi:hypothetical protein